MSQMSQLDADMRELIEKHGILAVMTAAAELLQWECRKCGHTWTPRLQAGRPLQCPRCKSRTWDKARTTPDGITTQED